LAALFGLAGVDAHAQVSASTLFWRPDEIAPLLPTLAAICLARTRQSKPCLLPA